LFHIHGGKFDKFYKNNNRLAKFYIREILNMSDRIITLSLTWKNFLESIIPKNKITIIENFVNSSQFTRFEREDNTSKNIITVLFVGGPGAEEKGLYDVFKAIPIVKKKFNNIMFLFVACPSIEKLNIIHEKELITSHTKFLGYIYNEKKIRIFYESDIFILPSYSEGLPITMLEAMAAGLPVIATSVGAIPEVIEDGKNGFLIKTGDYHALAEKILILAKDKKLRQKMGKNNIEKIRKQYGEEVVIKKLNNVYEKLLGN